MRYAGTLDKLRARRTARFEVRTRGHAGPLTAALEARGAAVESTRREDTIEVTLPDETDVSLVWQAAASAGEAIWHLEPRSLSLEEAFMALVGESRAVDA
jgi:hypothetical protein